jgi:hypothetical protein
MIDGGQKSKFLGKRANVYANHDRPLRSRLHKVAVAFLLVSVCSYSLAWGQSQPQHSSPVGMTHKIEQVVIPGSEVRVKPISEQTPVVVRILDIFPHGTNHRYDIEYYGLDPGSYNLIDFLQRTDGSSVDEVDAIAIKIKPQLPAGQVEPTRLTQNEITGLGGYKTTTIVFGVLWGVGLLAILFIGRRKPQAQGETIAPKINLADRLRPMVDEAIRGELSHAQLAELELTLIAFWRKRMRLDGEQASAVISKLKTHKEAGPLLVQLENWLHNPNSTDEVNVSELLQPYQSVPADAIELESTS